MRAFQAICVALAVAATRAQLHTYRSGISYGVAPAAISAVRTSYVSAQPAIATLHHSAPAVTIAHAAPAITRTLAVQAAPAIAIAAPAIRTVAVQAAPAISVAAAPAIATRAVNVGVIAAAPAAAIRTHEIHTGSGRQAIRIEDFQAGDQVIRVHEGPQAAPQIAHVQVPGEQHHIRVINHQSGPAHVERVVHRQQTQVVDVQKPGRPGARIVQVVKGESPAPQIEFINAGGSDHHVYHANDVSGGAVGGAAISVAAAPVAVHAVHAAPVVSRTIAVHHAQPTIAVHHAQPTIAVHHAQPTIAVHAAPAISVHHAAPIHTARVISAPAAVIGGASYHHGGSYGRSFGNTVVLHKA